MVNISQGTKYADLNEILPIISGEIWVPTRDSFPKKVSRYQVGKNVYEIRDGTLDDVLGLLRRDREVAVSSDERFLRRLTIMGENPRVPIGFYQAGMSNRYPHTPELTYNYVSSGFRENGIGLTQGSDFLLSMLKMGDFDSAVLIPLSGRSKFYDGLGNFSSRKKIQCWTEYEIDLRDKNKVKKVLTERLKSMGIEIL